MAIRVLVVDDHAVVAEGLRYLIDSKPDLNVVACVQDGLSAIRAARELQPDVVVMDISMPDLNGIDAARMIRERFPQVQVVMLSMHADHERVSRALQAGALGYVMKRSAPKEVVEAVRTVHAGARYVSHTIAEAAIEDMERGRSPEPLDALSARERQVLQLLVEGRRNLEIAKALTLSPKTVETYRARIMQKLNIADLPALVKFAIRRGLTSID